MLPVINSTLSPNIDLPQILGCVSLCLCNVFELCVGVSSMFSFCCMYHMFSPVSLSIISKHITVFTNRSVCLCVYVMYLNYVWVFRVCLVFVVCTVCFLQYPISKHITVFTNRSHEYLRLMELS